jgi:hypothetical protein
MFVLLHIAQTEDFYTRGLFCGNWNDGRLRFPALFPTRAELLRKSETVGAAALEGFAGHTEPSLGNLVKAPHAPLELPLRGGSGLCSNEIHHKALVAVYLRGRARCPLSTHWCCRIALIFGRAKT